MLATAEILALADRGADADADPEADPEADPALVDALVDDAGPPEVAVGTIVAA